jgi:4-amino-4-deoxy-L-arabinose transferase-like glycosyltransferase
VHPRGTRLAPFPLLIALVAIATLATYLVRLGAAGAWDPWETHYGEVARQILVRGDPLDLWWKPGDSGPHGSDETTFYSKPALPFWAMALSLWAFGIGTGPDPAELVQPLWPELALRLPGMLAGLGSAAFLGWVVARLHDRRAGLLTFVVLTTMPQWALVTRQALTDMFFVAPVVGAMGAWLLAFGRPDAPLPRRAIGRGRWAMELPVGGAMAAFAVVVLVGAVVPLAGLHQWSVLPSTAARVAGFGRGPGIPSWATLRAIHQHLFVYWGLLALVLWRAQRFRWRSQAWVCVVYVMAGVSLMAKGLIGPGLIGALIAFDLLVTARLRLLWRVELAAGIALFVVACFPWHHAMILYRGEPFVNEWIVINNLARFASGEQPQAVGSFVFYVRTAAIAALPWSAVAPLAIAWAMGAWTRPHAPPHASGATAAGAAHTPAQAGEPAVGLSPQSSAADPASGGDALVRACVLWLIVTAWVLSYAVTKYYHYLVPLLPPLAALVAMWLVAILDGREGARRMGLRAGLVALALALGWFALRDVLWIPAGFVHLTTYLYTGVWLDGAPPTTRMALACVPFAVGLLAWLWAARPGLAHAAGSRAAAVLAMVLSAQLATAWLLIDYVPAASHAWSQRRMFEIYFAERGPQDRMVSWWFYYRGETWFTKGDVWVLKTPERAALLNLVRSREGTGAGLWFVTTAGHANRLESQLPPEHRAQLRRVHASEHYALLHLAMPRIDAGETASPPPP